MACVLGGVIYFVCIELNFNLITTQTVSLVSVILIRVLAGRFHIGLPTLKEHVAEEKQS